MRAPFPAFSLSKHLQGFGPGVNAWANWRGLLAQLPDAFRLLAPDLAGFGYTDVPVGTEYS